MILRRTLFHRETPEIGGGEPIGAVAEPVDPGTGVPPTTEAGTPGAGPAPQPEWSLSREDYEAMQYAQAQQAQALQQIAQMFEPQQEEQGEYALPELDPFADDFAQQLAARDSMLVERIGAMFQQQIGPLTQYQQEQRLSQGEELAHDILADNVSQHGEFVDQNAAFDTARALANVFLEQEAERFGWGPRAGEAALTRAANVIRERDKAVSDAAIERYKNELAGLAGAPREPGVGATGSQMIGGERPDSLREIARRYTGAAA